MIQQGFRRGDDWTIREGQDESLPSWRGRVPASQQAPDGCDHYTPWQSGGEVAAVCTKCGTASAQACKDAHDQAVSYFQQQFPPDP